ncbi:hypothetical protein KKG90_10170 [Candidatus Bipolaricaulota bacterium]|nr:hypothetical protein [Candidatus Bipolaricaulota bacterium]
MGRVVEFAEFLLTVSSAFAAGADTRIIFDHNGNALISYSGSKDTLPTLTPRTQSTREDRLLASELALTTFMYVLDDSGSTAYGNGHVRAEFRTEVEYSNLLGSIFRELEGASMTYWTGTVPQTLSTEVVLSDTVKFGGPSIRVTVPAGAGASASGSTITWSGDDDDTWYLCHIYAGWRATSILYIGGTEHSTDGEHVFGEAHTWVSACARARGA